MTNEELIRAKEFLDYFRVNYNDDTIYLTSGGNSIIMNRAWKFGDFVGATINGVAEAVAKKMNKKTEWID